MNLKELLTTQGRLPRGRYWAYFELFYVAVFVLGGLMKGVETIPDLPPPVRNGMFFLVALPMFPLAGMAFIARIKRWHDRNKSGW